MRTKASWSSFQALVEGNKTILLALLTHGIPLAQQLLRLPEILAYRGDKVLRISLSDVIRAFSTILSSNWPLMTSLYALNVSGSCLGFLSILFNQPKPTVFLLQKTCNSPPSKSKLFHKNLSCLDKVDLSNNLKMFHF